MLCLWFVCVCVVMGVCAAHVDNLGATKFQEYLSEKRKKPERSAADYLILLQVLISTDGYYNSDIKWCRI